MPMRSPLNTIHGFVSLFVEAITPTASPVLTKPSGDESLLDGPADDDISVMSEDSHSSGSLDSILDGDDDIGDDSEMMHDSSQSHDDDESSE